MHANAENFSQADQRSFRIFTDQHGREWQGMIEKITEHPTGPWAPRFSSPLNKEIRPYLKIKDAAAGKFVIDYDAWIRDLKQAHAAYALQEVQVANALYGDKGPQAIKDNDPQLALRLGPRPVAIERVLAAKAGNRWVLGIPNPKTGQPEAKPKWADRFFPAPLEAKAYEFPNADEEFANEEEAEQQGLDGDAPASFPHRTRGNFWYLTRDHWEAVEAGDEKMFRGSEKEARDAASNRPANRPAAVGATHESWGG